jgi:hypothetical protein
VGVSAVCLAAVQLWPTLEYQRLALRWVGGDEPILASARIPIEVVARNPSLDLGMLPAALLLRGQIPDGGLYIGAGALVSAILGAALPATRVRFFWLVLLLLGIVLSLGTVTPLFGLVFQLPFVDQIREPVRYLLLAHLSLAVLVGLGLDYLVRTRKLAVAFGLLALASIELGVGWSASLPQRSGYNGTSNREVRQYYSSPEADGLAAFLASQPGLFRIDLTDTRLPRNYGDLLRIPTVGGYSATSPTKIQRFREELGFLPPDRGPDLLGTRYLISSKPLQGVREVGQAGSVTIFENARAFPLAWLVGEIRVVENDEQALLAVGASDLDPARVAVVTDEQAKGLAALSSAADGSATVTEYVPETVQITTRSAGSAVLVTSQADYPGWEATVDGRAATRLSVNYAFLGVPVPAGEHTVELNYRPLSFRAGASISLAALLASAVAVVWLARGRIWRSLERKRAA